jgi:hypothetical protein
VADGDITLPGQEPDPKEKIEKAAEEIKDTVTEAWEEHDVASGHLSAVAFNDALGQGRVSFTNGSVYEYDGCMRSEFEAIVRSPSAGAAFHHLWGGGSKPFRRVE